MTPSIRTFLLINLLLSITLITSLAIIGNLFLEHKDLQKHLNAQLSFAALALQAFIGDEIPTYKLSKIQRKINALPKIAAQHRKQVKAIPEPTFELVQFQIWDKNDKLLLRSDKAPIVPLSNNLPGFSTQWVNNQLWHVYSVRDPATNYRIDVGERNEFREELEGKVTQDSIFIMLITYPLLGVLIWIIVGRGLDSIRQVTAEIRTRVPSYLEPVSLENVPSEIEPLVDALNNLFTRLHDAFEREKRFAADAAHELRTPLAALKAQTQLALKVKDPKELQASMKKIEAGVDRSSHVVQQLLVMSKMVPQATLHNFSEVDLVSEAKIILADLAPKAIEKGTEIELVAQNDAVFFEGNTTAVGILIRNLVDNAILYTPPGSKVNVQIRKTAQHAVLTVEDNGPGIPAELQERVFERFFRVLGNKATGSGLGLGIVQQIVELHDATLNMDVPKKGTGLVVTVRFPL